MRRRLLALCILAMLSASALAAARPGGGGGYSGGGSRGAAPSGGGSRSTGGSSRSGGGFTGGDSHAEGFTGGESVGAGSGSNGPITQMTPVARRELRFAIALIALPVGLLLVGGLVVRLSTRRREESDDETLPDASRDAPRVGPPPSLDALVARDPALTFASIEARVHRMSEMIRVAWCAGDMRPARPVVSDGVFSRFQVQLALMRGEGRRNVMKDAQLLDVELEALESAAPLDVVHVRITARARDTEVAWSASAAQIERALSKAPLERYEEIWSLVRRHGATTTREASAFGRTCPSCGTSILDAQGGALSAVGEMIRCRYCGALLCSGEHDWVLAEITQTSEWHPGRANVRALDALRARDPELAIEALEDRASYLFWKWVQAGGTRSMAPLRKHAMPAFVAAGAGLEGIADLTEVAIGGVELVRVDPGALDYAYVKVFWSAKRGKGKVATPVRSVLRLARKPGVVMRASMTALNCGSCGAPLSESDTPTCDHCGTFLAAGDQAWVLEAVEPTA